MSKIKRSLEHMDQIMDEVTEAEEKFGRLRPRVRKVRALLLDSRRTRLRLASAAAAVASVYICAYEEEAQFIRSLGEDSAVPSVTDLFYLGWFEDRAEWWNDRLRIFKWDYTNVALDVDYLERLDELRPDERISLPPGWAPSAQELALYSHTFENGEFVRLV